MPGVGGAGMAAIGSLAAGWEAQTPSACIPRPRLPPAQLQGSDNDHLMAICEPQPSGCP